MEQLSVAWVKWLNDKYNLSVNRDDVNDWDIATFFPSLTPEQVFEPLVTDEFWDNVEPMPGAQEKIEQLINNGHDIYVVTSSIYKSLPAKLDRVLFGYFPLIDWRHVIVCHRKQMIKCDVMIDDGVHNLVGGEYEKILMTAPYNAEFDAAAYGIYRVNNWEEIYDLISALNKNYNSYVGVINRKKKYRNDIFKGAE